jgi:TolA-binding protein
MLNRVAFAAISAAFIAAIPARALAQAGPAELVVRMDRLENQIRQLTGQIEQMQYRNQQLEAALRRLQDDSGERRNVAAPLGGPPLGAPLGAQPGAAPPNQPSMPGGRRSDAFEPVENPGAPGAPRVLGSVPPQPPPSMSRRSDAFDPMENPNAPGAPRVLGSVPPQPAPTFSPQRGTGAEPAPYGAAAAAGAAVDPGSGQFPAGAGQRNPGSIDPYAVAAAPPSSPRSALDLGIGHLQRRDYALAE